MIKAPADSLRAAWGCLNQCAAALRADKHIPTEKKQIFLDRIDALQDDLALLSAQVKKAPQPTADQSTKG